MSNELKPETIIKSQITTPFTDKLIAILDSLYGTDNHIWHQMIAEIFLSFLSYPLSSFDNPRLCFRSDKGPVRLNFDFDCIGGSSTGKTPPLVYFLSPVIDNIENALIQQMMPIL